MSRFGFKLSGLPAGGEIEGVLTPGAASAGKKILEKNLLKEIGIVSSDSSLKCGIQRSL